MSAVKLASRYAKSLLDFAVEKGKLEEVYNSQMYLLKVIKASKDFDVLLASPLISADRKLKALKAVVGGNVDELTMLFLQLLIKKSREVYLKEISASFVLQYDVNQHITKVKITSAAPLDKKEIDNLLNTLKQQAKLETIQLSTEVDESLVGGFVLQYGDKQYDASIAKSLWLAKKGLEDNAYLKKLR
ncbi:MAG: ATP synthase F1 subunit delta [Chitinophagales bacterium]|nr:ATP synthase F1 subunit delta [Chitinophagales bacterium]